MNKHNSSKSLSFWENRIFLHFDDRQTDKQTNGQTDGHHQCVQPQSRYREQQFKNKIWQKTIFNMADEILTPWNVARSRHWFRQVTAHCNAAAACVSGIVTVNSPSGSTLQCDTWLWDDMPLTFARTFARIQYCLFIFKNNTLQMVYSETARLTGRH